MAELIYAMRFVGRAEPVPGDHPGGMVLRAATAAPSCSVTNVVGPDGLSSEVAEVAGADARFASVVAFTSETSFDETGEIMFGSGNALRFETVGSGYFGPGDRPSRHHCAVTWRVVGGSGQFAGATGLVTSNFFVDDQLAVVDHQFGVVTLPSA